MRNSQKRGFMSITFRDFPLSEAIQRAIAEVGYTEPTPIQAQSIPLILEGKDVIGRSHTGTGKTAASSRRAPTLSSEPPAV